MIEANLVAELKADAGVSALVGTRVYSAPMPEKAALPAVQWQLISNVPERVASGTLNYRRARFQVTTWAADRLFAINVAAAVRACLDEWSDSTTQVAWVSNEFDIYGNDFNPARHGRALDTIVVFKE